MSKGLSRAERLAPTKQIEIAIAQTARALRHTYEAYFEHLDLTYSQALLIAHLDARDEGALNQTEIAERLGLRKAAAGVAIESLVGRGLLTRSTDPTDARAKLISLSTDARTKRIAAEIDDAFGELAAAARKGISKADGEDLVRILDAIQANLTKAETGLRDI